MHYPLRPLEPKVSTGHYSEQYLPIPWAPQVSKVQQSTVHYPPGPWEPKSLQQSAPGKTQVSTIKPSSESTGGRTRHLQQLTKKIIPLLIELNVNKQI